jgi:hypothetical protein
VSADPLIRADQKARRRLQRLETVDYRPLVARAGRSSNQSITTGGSYQIIDYNSTAFDPRSCITTSPNWRFIAKVGGYYWVSAQAVLDVSAGWAQGEQADLRVYINGSGGPSLALAANIGSGGSPLLSGAVLLHLAENDYVQIRIWQNSGGAINLVGDVNTCWMSIAKVAP